MRFFKRHIKEDEDSVKHNKGKPRYAPPEKIPKIFLQPPLIFGIFLVLTMLINQFFPLKLEINFSSLLGVIMGIFGIFINMWSMNKFRKYKTSSHVKHQAFRLIDEGPYRYSRNPLYLGTAFMIFGFGLAFDLVWVLIGNSFAIVIIHYFVVLPEENYLIEIFGDKYITYAKKVRRWI